MKYIKLSNGYFFKNSWWLLLVWLLPSVFVGLCTGPFQLIEFMNKYPSTVINSYGDIFKILMPISWQGVVFIALGIVLISIFLSMSFGETESHMRSGKLDFKGIFSYVNNDILVTVINIVIIELVYVALTFILGSIMFLLHLLLSGFSCVPTVLNVVIAITLCVAVLILFFVVQAMFLLNIPNMISNGYSLKEGISSTSQLMSRSTFKLLLAYIAPYLIIIPLISLSIHLNLLWLANIVCYLLMASYYSCVTMTSYFELSGTSRYDNRKYYNYR